MAKRIVTARAAASEQTFEPIRKAAKRGKTGKPGGRGGRAQRRREQRAQRAAQRADLERQRRAGGGLGRLDLGEA